MSVSAAETGGYHNVKKWLYYNKLDHRQKL